MPENEAGSGHDAARTPGGPVSPYRCMLAVTVLMAAWTPTAARAQVIHGHVSDLRTGDPVPNALVQLGLTEHYAVSNEQGNFSLRAAGESGTQTLIVTAPGYAKRYEPWAMEAEGDVIVTLAPQPIELGEIEASVLTYRARIDRRLNQLSATDTGFYAIEGPLLERSTAKDVWDLVRIRHGFRFEGFSDYGCTRATIEGVPVIGELFIDDRPVRIGTLQEHAPQHFTRVEVIDKGRIIRAYTQEYLDWMTQNEKSAVPFLLIPGLCPPTESPPGTMRRGRPVGTPGGEGARR